MTPSLLQRAPTHGITATILREVSRFLLILGGLSAIPAIGMAAVPSIQDPSEIVDGYVELITDTEVAIQIEASDQPTSYGASNLPPGLSINSETGIIEGSVSNPFFEEVTLTATNAEGTGIRTVNFYVYEREPANLNGGDRFIENGLDVVNEMAPFTQSAYNKQTDFFYRLTGGGSGNDLIRNNNTSDNSITGVKTYIRGPAQVTFSWRVNIEPIYDVFGFYINNSLVTALYGTTAWADYVHDLGPGLHRLEWLYIKDVNDWAGGANQCFLDNVRVTGYPAWAGEQKLSSFNSAFNVDQEQDGNNLLMEYALKLRPDRLEIVSPLMTFEPDGRAILEIGKNKNAIGVTVDIEKMNLANPGTWTPVPDTVTNSSSKLIKRESTPQPKGAYRVKVTSP